MLLLQNQVLNTTISDLFSTAAFGLFADSSADSDRVKNNLERAVKDITVGPREADPVAVAQINSHLGLIKHADTMRIRKKWLHG